MNTGRKKIIIFFSVLAVFQILLIQPSPSFADRMKDIKKELADKRTSHNELTKKSKTLNKEVIELKQDIVKVSINAQKSEEELFDTEQHLKELKSKKAAYIENIYRDQQAMGGLVSAARKYSSTPAISMLAQNNPVNAARAFTVIKSVIPSIHNQSSYLKAQLKEIQTIETDITQQLEKKVGQNKKYSQQEEKLKSLLEDREKLYQETEDQRILHEKEMAELLQESKSLEDLMSKLKDKSNQEYSLSNSQEDISSISNLLPVKGRIYTNFGERDDLGATSKGLTFITRPNAKIITPMDGVIKFAGPFQHYKQILIVEHKNGYHSLIAGLEKINTVVGAHLSQGEPVGVSENTDDSKIYYELRHNGKPINPQKLLLAQKR